MADLYTVPLSTIVEQFNFEKLYLPDNYETILISTPEVSRPGLALAGFYELFEKTRIQMIGNAECRYLNSLSKNARRTTLKNLAGAHPVAIVLTAGNASYPELDRYTKEENVPLLRTQEKTSAIMASLVTALNNYLAPRITRHGVLVDVYGEGLLLLGDSGVGKSETAIELVKRGHRLIADDAVEIKRISSGELVGTAPEIIRHYIELRGIGIVDVRRLFGMGAVMDEGLIDLVIQLEPWVDGKMYDRLGLDDHKINILGVNIPTITIPVKPGRNLAIILEIAAMNNRQKKMGYNTAEEFNKRLMQQMEIE
ncbi:MAG: HPr(Ser) kinase/phosphatase [Clostridia bacterium]|nr:HPr(Ser) kinase/phosphatase [Clostridia bacterium]